MDHQSIIGRGEPLPVATSLPSLPVPLAPAEDDGRARPLLRLSALAIGIAVLAAVAAHVLAALITLLTNLAFFGRASLVFTSPSQNHLGPWVILVPVVGALVVGVMARYGSEAIRGHGIPEAMEQVLLNESRIAPRITLLKPLSAAVSIGTGGPFGAEGPIIATGGALGSLVGQLVHGTADDRRILLAAGAAAGMAAIFGSPVSAVLLAVELLLFEYRPRSLIPVSLAASTAIGVRTATLGSTPVFAMPDLASPTGAALATYIVLGAVIGLIAVAITKMLYAIEDGFEHLPVHWMWWPAIGALVVGVVGWVEPSVLGVGYDNITHIVSGTVVGRALVMLVALKFVAWVIALGSGTSGGTLAPLFTIGGGLGALIGGELATHAPMLGVDPRMAAVVGMAAIFAGSSHALLTSVVFAFETTRQAMGLLPLLAGCSAAYLISLSLMRHSIMTEKLARRGTRVRSEYGVDWLERVSVRDIAEREVVTLREDDAVEDIKDWMASHGAGSAHQGYPVLDADGALRGVVTRRDLLDPSLEVTARVGELLHRAPIIVFEDHSAREAADHMVRERVGRLPVVSRDDPTRVVGIVSRSDLLEAHASRLHASERAGRALTLTELLPTTAAFSGDGRDGA